MRIFNSPRFFARSRNLIFLAIVFLFLLSSCSALERFEKRALIIESKNGPVIIVAEIASTPKQHEQGLMHRKQLNDGEGMLFIFERDAVRSFWMKNTLIPLSIAYIASDGRIVEIYDMEPENLSSVTSSRSVRYALEVPQGWFSRTGLEPGDKLVIENAIY